MIIQSIEIFKGLQKEKVFDKANIKWLIVNEVQVFELSKLLGIVIK